MNITVDITTSSIEEGIGYWLRRAQQTVLHDFSETFGPMTCVRRSSRS